MIQTDRRQILAALAATLAVSAAPSALLAQQPQPAEPPPAPPQPQFGFEQVVNQAREIAAVPFEAAPAVPEAIARLDAEAWRGIRFKPDRALLGKSGRKCLGVSFVLEELRMSVDIGVHGGVPARWARRGRR